MKKLLPALLALAIAQSALADDGKLTMSAGFDYSTGKYGGTTSTDILYLPFTAKYETDSNMLQLTVPYISVTGTGGVYQGLGRVGGPRSARSTTTSGLGDVIVSAGHTMYGGDALTLDLVGNVKFGTAQSPNLGTGANDYSVQADGYYTADRTTLFATGGYKKVGVPANLPPGTTVNNVAYGLVGASQKVSDKNSVGFMLYVQQAASTPGAGPKEVTLFLEHHLSKNVKVQANVLKGLSDGSPNVGVGGMIAATF